MNLGSLLAGAFSAAILVVGALHSAAAADICKGGPKDQWLKPENIRELVKKMGYEKFVLAFEDGCYEAKIVNSDKSKTEIYLDPVTGKVERTKQVK